MVTKNLDLQEQEQVAELKAWWNRWGNAILTGATLVLLLIAAYNGWQWYQRSQAGNAAAAYDAVQQGAQEKDLKRVREGTSDILQNYPRTGYAPLAALVAAKVYFDAGDLKNAKLQLEWVVANAREPELQSIGRLRLANLLVDEKSFDEALKLIGEKMEKPFAATAAGLRGDILALQGKKADARTAYKAAIDAADTKDTALRDRVQQKLDALGES